MRGRGYQSQLLLDKASFCRKNPALGIFANEHPLGMPAILIEKKRGWTMMVVQSRPRPEARHPAKVLPINSPVTSLFRLPTPLSNAQRLLRLYQYFANRNHKKYVSISIGIRSCCAMQTFLIKLLLLRQNVQTCSTFDPYTMSRNSIKHIQQNTDPARFKYAGLPSRLSTSK